MIKIRKILVACRKFFLFFRSGLSQVLFTLGLWFLVGALSWILFQELVKKDHNPALLATSVVLLLLVILFNQYEGILVPRLKKIGPLELFEEAQDIISGFEEIEKLRPRLGAISTRATQGGTSRTLYPSFHKLPSHEAFHCQQGDVAVSLLEFTNSQPEKTKYRSNYFDLLCKVGTCAFVQNDWARAVARLEKLRELSADSFSPEVVLPVLGLSYFYWALEERDTASQKERFGRAADVFLKVIKLGRAYYLTYFHLAYAQDELGLFHEAVESNKEALKRRPRFAPARYNSAVSYVKLGEFKSAFEMLTEIRRQDEEGSATLNSILADEELKPLREHPKWKDKVAALLEADNDGSRES